jgi:hydroxymethylpyrimidine/phosphomethylpyrimidine kinase
MVDSPRYVLTIAGSDPSGGAGIQADLKTFAAFGVYGMAVITALTAQNTRGVRAIHCPPVPFVAEELSAVFDDIRVDGVKTGMLPNSAVIRAVAACLAERIAVPLVVDPVMVATSGDRLIEDDAVEALRHHLFPLAALVTPNIEEAAVLAGHPVADLPAARSAARGLLREGPRAVLVKGLPDGPDLVDLLVFADGERAYRHPALRVGPTHGTGCTLSAAIAASLARGDDLPLAVERAVDYVSRAIREARPVGSGGLPLNHLVRPAGGGS